MEVIIVEVKDRGRIGGLYFKIDVICCNIIFVKDGYCKVGEVII